MPHRPPQLRLQQPPPALLSMYIINRNNSNTANNNINNPRCIHPPWLFCPDPCPHPRPVWVTAGICPVPTRPSSNRQCLVCWVQDPKMPAKPTMLAISNNNSSNSQPFPPQLPHPRPNITCMPLQLRLLLPPPMTIVM